MAKRKELRRRDPEARRQAILEAGLAIFAAEGFQTTKLDDVAEKAGVAKGTIYLYFNDKQDLFEQIARDAIAPVIARLEGVAKLPDLPTEVILKEIFDLFRIEVLGTSRRQVLRLVLLEGPQFPVIAEFYHREVVCRGFKLLADMLRRAKTRGELSSDRLSRFPHLVVAPLMLALIWDSLFARMEPLDVEGLLSAHRDLLLCGKRLGDQK